MRRVVAAILCSMMTASAGLAAEPVARPKLAVAEFDFALSGRTLPPPEMGSSAAQAMVDRLVSSGEFQVYDAGWLAKRRPDGPADMDQMRLAAEHAGIDYLALGTITQFSEEQSHRRIGGGALRFPVLAGADRRNAELVVGLIVKLVDVRSGEIVTTATGYGTALRTKIKAGALALLSLGGVGGYSRGSDQYRGAQLGEAVQRSVESASQGLVGWRRR